MLALSRVANLPTVWSNCLAGWWLSGGGEGRKLPLLFAGASFLYLGGAFLNDAFDARYDREHRRARPIPSGAITADSVWWWGLAWMGLGLISLFWLGPGTGCLGLALAGIILAYNATHRLITFSPVLLGLCRLMLYLAAASTSAEGITGWPIWCGLALAVYVIGLGCLARAGSLGGPVNWRAALLLGAPIVLALLMDVGNQRVPGLELSAVLGLWIIYCLRPGLMPWDGDVSRISSGLVAGIVLVDWLAVLDVPRELSLLFLAFFGAALLLERLAPAS
jgi:4-hydroxybenzoate polyprenyltransferase